MTIGSDSLLLSLKHVKKTVTTPSGRKLDSVKRRYSAGKKTRAVRPVDQSGLIVVGFITGHYLAVATMDAPKLEEEKKEEEAAAAMEV